MFSNPFPNAFGLDIGDVSLKIVQLRNISSRTRTPTYELMGAKTADIPDGWITNGIVEKPEDVRNAIAQLLKKDVPKTIQRATKSPWVVASLPETQSFIKFITIPKPPTELLDDDVFDAAEKHIPFERNSFYIDWQIMPSDDPITTSLIIGAIPKMIADSYTYLLESLGLGVIALEIEALSLGRAMVTAGKEYKEEARLILDLGAARSSCIVHDHDVIQLSMSIPYSGNALDTQIAKDCTLSVADARKKKQTYGLTLSGQDKKIFTILKKETDDLVAHIKNIIEFYYSHFERPNKITHITMSGGGANMKQLPEVLSQALGIECAPGHPWKNLSTKKGIGMTPEESLGYATGIGLALRAADNLFLKHDTL